mmetsp:Transcript_20592/g.44765  ORF Transcript_20592/g.44765 Transcript_20592/m.44765 type:complete len:483 (+) Transcript_20592:393-1841(+)
MLDVREAGWPIVYANPAFETTSGLDLEDLAGAELWELFENPGKTDAELGSLTGSGDSFGMNLFCNVTKMWISFRLLPATSDRLAPSKATGIPSWVPSVDSPPGSKLGVDVDNIVDITERDCKAVPDAKCFWFAMVMGKPSSDAGHGSSTTSAGPTGSDPDSSDDGIGSAFGEYRRPSGLSKFQFGPLLGSGSFGKVYRGTSENNLSVAIKVIDCRCRDTGSVSNQLSEVKLTESLDHPGVVKILEHGTSTEKARGTHTDVLWIVQEFCDMGTLTDAAERGWFRVKRHITAPPDMAVILPTLRDIAAAMAYVHDKGVIHADLNGRNVLLTSSPSRPHGFVAKVCDFGLARMTEHGGSGINTKTFGTVTHMPPSLLMNQVLYPASDIWAFGVIAWEALYGKRCYGGKNAPQIIMTVISNRPLEWPEDAPEPFTALMKKCLMFDYKERPPFCAIVPELDVLSSLGLTLPTEPSSLVEKKAYVGAV